MNTPGLFRPTWTDKRTKEKRTSTTWWIRYTCRHLCPEGAACPGVHRENSNTESERDAKRMLADKKSAVNQGKPVTASIEKTTWEQLAEVIRTNYVTNNRKSLRRLNGSLAHLTKYFRGRKATTITTAAIASYTESRQKAGAAPATIRNEQAVLKRSLHLGVKAGMVGRVPDIEMIPNRALKVRQGFFTQPEIDAVIAALPQDVADVVTFLSLVGWRVNEALSLKWEYVSFEHAEIRLSPEHSKNGKPRVLPFSLFPRLSALLYERAAKKNGPMVFHRAGKPIVNFRVSWRRATKEAGCVGRLVHDLRRTVARNLIASGCSEQVAMMVTGHETNSIFKRYAIVSNDDLAQATRRLSALLDGSSGVGKQTSKSALPAVPAVRQIA